MIISINLYEMFFFNNCLCGQLCILFNIFSSVNILRLKFDLLALYNVRVSYMSIKRGMIKFQYETFIYNICIHCLVFLNTLILKRVILKIYK